MSDERWPTGRGDRRHDPAGDARRARRHGAGDGGRMVVGGGPGEHQVVGLGSGFRAAFTTGAPTPAGAGGGSAPAPDTDDRRTRLGASGRTAGRQAERRGAIVIVIRIDGHRAPTGDTPRSAGSRVAAGGPSANSDRSAGAARGGQTRHTNNEIGASTPTSSPVAGLVSVAGHKPRELRSDRRRADLGPGPNGPSPNRLFATR